MFSSIPNEQQASDLRKRGKERKGIERGGEGGRRRILVRDSGCQSSNLRETRRLGGLELLEGLPVWRDEVVGCAHARGRGREGGREREREGEREREKEGGGNGGRKRDAAEAGGLHGRRAPGPRSRWVPPSESRRTVLVTQPNGACPT